MEFSQYSQQQIILILFFLTVSGVVYYAARKIKKEKLKRLEEELNKIEDTSQEIEATEKEVIPAETDKPQPSKETEEPPTQVVEAPQKAKEQFQDVPEKGLKAGLKKTREGFIGKLVSLFTGKNQAWEDLEEELEEILYTADLGVKTTEFLLEQIQSAWKAGNLKSENDAKELLKEKIKTILSPPEKPLFEESENPWVVLFIGVNGVGKTTTIGKLALYLKEQGKSVIMGAGDTFRAAAGEQLEVWAERAGAEIIKGSENADPSSVIFDTVNSAVSKKTDVVLADTAGRLHTKVNLMEELKKMKRVVAKAKEGAPHRIVLVLDAHTGQNAIKQAQEFNSALQIDGLIITKLDGTAKGGVVVGISHELNLPIYHIGVGESIKDLRHFKADEFAEALFESEEKLNSNIDSLSA